jgi:hypothetical protein
VLDLRRYVTDRAVNGLLLLMLVVLAATGVAGLFANDAQHRLVFEAHRVGAAAFLVLLLPKCGIVARALRRKVPGGTPRVYAGLLVSVLLLLLTVAVVAAALGWALARGPWDGLWGLPLIVVHWYLALALLPVAAAHVAMRWRRAGRLPRLADFRGRRRLLALAAAAALALTSRAALASGAAGTEQRTGRRRFTGLREADYGTPNGFFVTSFLNDNPAPLDLATWRLRIAGNVARPLTLAHADLRVDAALVATVDCTGGVYATREWAGLALGPLLDAAGVAGDARLAWFISTTGHRWLLPIGEARRALLATHVGGEPLAHEHGFPLRLVAPERRGFQWIKWLATIEIV